MRREEKQVKKEVRRQKLLQKWNSQRKSNAQGGVLGNLAFKSYVIQYVSLFSKTPSGKIYIGFKWIESQFVFVCMLGF